MDNSPLALEMLRELKSQSKRWFIIAVIELIIIIATNTGWLIYESTFESVTEEQTQEAYYNDNSTITQNIE